MKSKHYVYLIPGEAGTYTASIQSAPPCEKAVVLTAEGKYPVEYYYRRLDINGSQVIESEVCANREELLYCLNCDGAALHTIRSLWKFDACKARYHDAWAVFNAATDKFMEIISNL